MFNWINSISKSTVIIIPKTKQELLLNNLGWFVVEIFQIAYTYIYHPIMLGSLATQYSGMGWKVPSSSRLDVWFLFLKIVRWPPIFESSFASKGKIEHRRTGSTWEQPFVTLFVFYTFRVEPIGFRILEIFLPVISAIQWGKVTKWHSGNARWQIFKLLWQDSRRERGPPPLFTAIIFLYFLLSF